MTRPLTEILDSFGAELPEPNKADAHVPCGTCKRCCEAHSTVLILEDYGDRLADYDTVAFPLHPEFQMLRQDARGRCIYLGEHGCSIHGRAPYMCRIFDCREQHRMYTKEERAQLVKVGALSADVLRRGAALIHQEQKRHTKKGEPKPALSGRPLLTASS